MVQFLTQAVFPELHCKATFHLVLSAPCCQWLWFSYWSLTLKFLFTALLRSPSFSLGSVRTELVHQINSPLSRWVIIYLNVSQHSHFHVSLNIVPQFGTAHDATSHFSVRSAVGFQVQFVSNLGLAAFLRA